MADDVVVIRLEDDDDDEIDEALNRLERLVAARGLGEVAGRMQGLGTVVFIDVAPKLVAHVEQVVLPSLRELVAEVGLEGARVEIPPEADDDDDEWDDDDDDDDGADDFDRADVDDGQPDDENPNEDPEADDDDLDEADDD